MGARGDGGGNVLWQSICVPLRVMAACRKPGWQLVPISE